MERPGPLPPESSGSGASRWRARALGSGIWALLAALSASATERPGAAPEARPRAREVGVVVGILPPGPMNAITDVSGVRVGHSTVLDGESVRTGVTAIAPHGGNVFRDRVPAAIVVGNGFGKLLGVTQVEELGELETPILLTCTLCVWKAADALVEVLLSQPGMEGVRSINPVVGETNDGRLNAIRDRPIRKEHVLEALSRLSPGPVAEGAVGAGTGTVAFGFKGGIGTSSRKLPSPLGGHTVGVLVQSNFGGVLTVNGAPVGRALGRFALQDALGRKADGSIMMVVATDAPLGPGDLRRLARRALTGLARTGAAMSHGSGDYVIAFSTVRDPSALADPSMSPLFQAVAEATEEAVLNSLFKARTTRGNGITVEALPLRPTLDVLRRHDALGWDRSLPPGRGEKR